MKLTSEQLKRIIAEEVSRVIAEVGAALTPAKVTGINANPGDVNFGASGFFSFVLDKNDKSGRPVQVSNCQIDEDPVKVFKNMKKCAENAGFVLDNDSWRFAFKPGDRLKTDLGVGGYIDPEIEFGDTRRSDFMRRHNKGSRALLSTTER